MTGGFQDDDFPGGRQGDQAGGGRSAVERMARELSQGGNRKAAPSEVSWGDTAGGPGAGGARRLQKQPETSDRNFLTDTFEKFFRVTWTLLPDGFRHDVWRWWGAKADMQKSNEQGADSQAHRELVAIDIVKAIGYVLSPDLFIEKHGEGQVQHLNPNDVKFAKQLCLKHNVPHKYRGQG